MAETLTDAEIEAMSLEEVLRWSALRAQTGLLRGLAAKRLGLTVDDCPYPLEDDSACIGWRMAFQPPPSRED